MRLYRMNLKVWAADCARIAAYLDSADAGPHMKAAAAHLIDAASELIRAVRAGEVTP